MYSLCISIDGMTSTSYSASTRLTFMRIIIIVACVLYDNVNEVDKVSEDTMPKNEGEHLIVGMHSLVCANQEIFANKQSIIVRHMDKNQYKWRINLFDDAGPRTDGMNEPMNVKRETSQRMPREIRFDRFWTCVRAVYRS